MLEKRNPMNGILDQSAKWVAMVSLATLDSAYVLVGSG